MRRFLLSVIFLSMVCVSAHSQGTAPATEASRDPTFGACRAGSSIVVASLCPGQTLGSKVNAADAALGSKAGEIWLYGGGAFGDENSRIIVSSNHALRIFPGTYTSTGYNGVILLKDDASLICQDSANTILQEPTHAIVAGADNWGIVLAYGEAFTGPSTRRWEPNRNINVRGCRFRGARSDFHAGFAAVLLGNCHNCETSGNVFENIHAISWAIGSIATLGTDPLSLGKYAEGSSLHHNLFIHGNAVNAACTNCQNVDISNNTFLRPGYSGQSFPVSIDLEPNSSSDRMLMINVTNNLVDHFGAETVGDGIDVSNASIPAAMYGQILIKGNQFRGGLVSTALVSRGLRFAIAVNSGANDVQVIDNTIRFTRNSSIKSDGQRSLIKGNSIFGDGTPDNGAYPILLGPASSDNLVAGNWVYCNLSLTKACSTLIRNQGAASNSISDNLGTGVR